MEWLKHVVDYGIIGFLALLNIISAVIAAGLLVAIPSVALYNFLLGEGSSSYDAMGVRNGRERI